MAVANTFPACDSAFNVFVIEFQQMAVEEAVTLVRWHGAIFSKLRDLSYCTLTKVVEPLPEIRQDLS